MKIAIIGSKGFDTLEFHLKDEFEFQKNEVKIFDLMNSVLHKKIDSALNLFSQTYVELINKSVLHSVLEYNPDLVIGSYRHIHPLLVKGIKQKKIKIIHVNPDQLTTLQNQQIFVEPYDSYFTKDNFMASFMKDKMGLNVFTYNEAFNPRHHSSGTINYKETEEEIEIDVLTFGNLYPYRNRMIKQLLDKNIDIKMFGHKTKHFPNYLDKCFQNRAIYGQEKAKILSGSKIVFNNFHYAEIESVNNKFFEINGSGAFQICDYKPILNELLPIDPKLVSFNTIDEAEKLIKHYLNNPEERYSIRGAVQEHFLKNHTYKNLINYILSCV